MKRRQILKKSKVSAVEEYYEKVNGEENTAQPALGHARKQTKKNKKCEEQYPFKSRFLGLPVKPQKLRALVATYGQQQQYRCQRKTKCSGDVGSQFSHSTESTPRL